MKALISKRAVRAAERIDVHWREHADEPDIFASEFVDAISRLQQGSPGTSFQSATRPSLKRILLSRSRCHIDFETNESTQTIHILHVWDRSCSRASAIVIASPPTRKHSS